jgi:hypothetical protein
MTKTIYLITIGEDIDKEGVVDEFEETLICG